MTPEVSRVPNRSEPAGAPEARGRLQGRLAPADGWVFLGKRGRSRIGETTLFRAWCRLRDRFDPFEITPLRLHDLRHTWASLAIEGGLPIPWVAEQLGHADAATTLRIYAHVMPRPEVDFRFLGAAEVGRNKSVTGRNKSPVEAEAGSG